MAITLDDIKTLRARTGAGMADCKKALEEADGNMDGAIDILRKKGAATAAKRADKAADEGVISTAVNADHSAAAIVEINCETDFVARNEEFSTFAEAVARLVLNSNPSSEAELMAAEIDGTSVEKHLNDLLAKFSERIEIRRYDRIESEGGFLADYVHGGARLAVLVELEGVTDAAKGEGLARDVAMQVAAMNPAHVRREDVTDSTLEKEREIYREQLAAENKPVDILEKIVNGRIEKYYEQNVLLEQSFVKDSSKSVQEVLRDEAGDGVTVRRFIRYNLGEAVDEPISG